MVIAENVSTQPVTNAASNQIFVNLRRTGLGDFKGSTRSDPAVSVETDGSRERWRLLYTTARFMIQP